MGIFSTSDEELIHKFEKEESEMLWKIYGLKKSDINCPSNPYLLNPERLHLSSFENIDANKLKLNVGYKTTWSGYVTNSIRMNYSQIILGSIFCNGVEDFKKTPFNRRGNIKIPFLSKNKIVNVPVNAAYNIQFKCKELIVEEIDIYVEKDNKLILDIDYREELRKQLEK